MKKLDRYILKSFIGPFVAILAVVLFILVMQFLWLYIDELVGKGLALKVIAEFLMWGGCTILPLALPLATLLAAMMIMGTLSGNNELIAMKTAGVSFARIMLPVMVASAIISVGAFFAANDLVPYSYDKIYTLRDDINRTKEEIKIPPGTFYDGIDGYILRVEDTDDETGMMHGIMVYDHTRTRSNNALTIADSASMKMSKDKDYLTFTLYNGTNYSEDNQMHYRDTAMALQRVDFAEQELIIALKNYSFQKSDSSRFSDQLKTMPLKQLKIEQDSLRAIDRATLEKHASRIHTVSLFSKYKQLDTAFYREDIPPFENENYMKWDDLSDKINAYEEASNKADNMIQTLTGFSRESYEHTFYLRRADLEIFKKFSGALACLILFFIGAPIGALIRKGGLGTPAIISTLFFVLYWVVGLTGEKLAKDGALSPSAGAFISTYVLFPIGLFLTWKAINDTTILNMDSFKSEFRKIKSKVLGFFRKTRIVYMGTPEFAVAPLEALLKKKYKVVGVVTVADKPSGRGLKMNESAVKKYAVEKGIPVLQPVKLKDPEFLKELAALKADLFVVVAFRMLPEEVWKMPRLGTFNLHAALLPQYRGAAPINWAVINGENMTGVTTFMIDQNIDTGGIILREEYRIKPTDTAGDVHDALMGIGAGLVVETVEGIIQGNVETRVQRSFIQGSEVLHPAPKITRELQHIDWNDSSRNICNLIRGLSPYPAAFTEITREGSPEPLQMKIYSAEKMECSATALPGTILSDGKTYLAVKTEDGAVSIRDLQLSGKKRMDVKSFLLGFREPESWTCTQGSSKAEIEKTKTA